MTSSAARFAPHTDQDVTRLVLDYPFAWIVTTDAGDFAATPLPLRPVVDGEGSVAELRGHFARSNAHVALVRRVPRALLLFMGPHGYISSSWLADRTRTPTWNYAMVQYLVDIEFIEDAAQTNEVVRDLVDAMESGRPGAWSMDEMGPRYERLVSGIIAFRAHIRERRVKFKLGQDERDAEYSDILSALTTGGYEALHGWMQRSNVKRADR